MPSSKGSRPRAFGRTTRTRSARQPRDSYRPGFALNARLVFRPFQEMHDERRQMAVRASRSLLRPKLSISSGHMVRDPAPAPPSSRALRACFKGPNSSRLSRTPGSNSTCRHCHRERLSRTDRFPQRSGGFDGTSEYRARPTRPPRSSASRSSRDGLLPGPAGHDPRLPNSFVNQRGSQSGRCDTCPGVCFRRFSSDCVSARSLTRVLSTLSRPASGGPDKNSFFRALTFWQAFGGFSVQFPLMAFLRPPGIGVASTPKQAAARPDMQVEVQDGHRPDPGDAPSTETLAGPTVFQADQQPPSGRRPLPPLPG